MALNLTNLFTALGRVGRNSYLICTAQDAQDTSYSQLAGYAYVNPSWILQLTSVYDQMIRSETAGMPVWSQIAKNILLGFVYADAPGYGQNLTSALTYLQQQMVDQAKTIQKCTIGGSGYATAAASNTGDAKFRISVTRGDGLVQQNAIAETTTFVVTADSYTGGLTAGQESWQWVGESNVSSLGTGARVGVWDWDWPQGSGSSTGGNLIASSQEANTSTNLLTNGSFTDWTGTPLGADSWYTNGTWGTDYTRTATPFASTYAALLAIGSTAYLTQQFDSSVTNPTDATAGTSAAPSVLTTYLVNVWLRATAGTVSAGTLRVAFVDNTGTVINDEAGNAASFNIDLTTTTTTYAAFGGELRLPADEPAIVRLEIKPTVALVGDTVLIADVVLTPGRQLYPAGPTAAGFSGATPVVKNDSWTDAITNDRGGASYGATFQTLINRLFRASDLILPYSGTPDYADTLITNA